MNALKWKRVTANTACVYYMDRSGKWVKVQDEAPISACKNYVEQNQEQIYPYIVAYIGTRANAKRHVMRKIMAVDKDDAVKYFNEWVKAQQEAGEDYAGTLQLLTGNWTLVTDMVSE